MLDREHAAISYGSVASNEPHHAASDPAKVKQARREKKGAALAALLSWARDKGATQIAITRSWAKAAGLPDDDSLPLEGLEHPWADLPAKGDWSLRHPGKLRTSLWASPTRGGRTIEVLLSCYDPRVPFGEAGADEAAAGLALFREATASPSRSGFAYRQSPQATFNNIWQTLARDAGAVDVSQTLAPADFPAPAHLIPEPAADIGWMRSPTDEERQAQTCVVIDANSQYLRAMAGLACGIGTPVHHERPSFDKRRPGYWRLTWQADAWPLTLPAAGWPLEPGREGWLTTETVAFLAEIGASLDIQEAWLWESGRALDRLQSRLRDGLYQLKGQVEAGTPGAAHALKLLKTVYKSGIGSWSMRDARALQAPDDRHRPHWRHALMGRSSALLLRDLATRTDGLHPVAIATDGLAFLTDRPAERLGLKLGDQLGAYSLERSFPAQLMLDALDALTAARLAGDDRKRERDAIGTVQALITGNKG